MVLARMGVLALVALCSFQASAAEPGFYFGITGGRVEYDFDEVHVPVATLPPGGIVPTIPSLPPNIRFTPAPSAVFTVPAYATVAYVGPLVPFGVAGIEHEDDDTSWSALVGYRISRYFAAEVKYVSLGELTLRRTYSFPTLPPIQSKHTLETQGPTLTLMAILPVRNGWDVHASAGAFFMDTKAESRIASSKFSTTVGSEGAFFGLGTQYNFGEHWSVRLHLQRYKHVGEKRQTGEADIDDVSLGVLYRL